ncbi:hypothetical protein Y717_17980 [Streptomyces scopuliridis RB72]|uniref:Uncharacterized protein n=1 Tax=Streptomyces scopuliridis RB72 TaxID=1440053 RepID=A0A2T7TEE8_9ACTN|nr:hypothetical protein Y717_17980 [Streptomyces scopuliridis RB72]
MWRFRERTNRDHYAEIYPAEFAIPPNGGS